MARRRARPRASHRATPSQIDVIGACRREVCRSRDPMHLELRPLCAPRSMFRDARSCSSRVLSRTRHHSSSGSGSGSPLRNRTDSLGDRNWDNVEAQVERKRPLKTLERVLSKAGIGSRVEARSWIHAGRVHVNGKVLRNPDHWVDMQRDRVRFDGKPLVVRERVYLLLYKPTGYLTTYKDPEGRPTVYDLIADVGTFLSPVGRLDLDTSGLLLMTNDNRFAERVTNPESHVPKTYLVKASALLTDAHLAQMREGIELADGRTLS